MLLVNTQTNHNPSPKNLESTLYRHTSADFHVKLLAVTAMKSHLWLIYIIVEQDDVVVCFCILYLCQSMYLLIWICGIPRKLHMLDNVYANCCFSDMYFPRPKSHATRWCIHIPLTNCTCTYKHRAITMKPPVECPIFTPAYLSRIYVGKRLRTVRYMHTSFNKWIPILVKARVTYIEL